MIRLKMSMTAGCACSSAIPAHVFEIAIKIGRCEMKKFVLLICFLSLLLTACETENISRTNSEIQTTETEDHSLTIEATRTELLSYFENHKLQLEELSHALLGIVTQASEINSANVYFEEAEVELFSAKGSERILPTSEFPSLDELLAATEIESSPIAHITVSDSLEEGDFDSPCCGYGVWISVDGQPYYYINLIYTETANADARFPEMVKQLDPHWYILGHYAY